MTLSNPTDQRDMRGGEDAGAAPAGGAGAVAPRLSSAQFAASFQASWRTLWCVAVGVLGSRSLAEDAVQEAAVIALGKLDDFDPGTSFTAWMARIVRFVALNQARRRVREGRAVAHAAGLEGLSTHAPREPQTAHTLPDLAGAPFETHVAAALESLPETARSCLLMRTLLDLSYREIAAALGIPEGTAMSHVHRARAAMRTALSPGPRGSERTSAMATESSVPPPPQTRRHS